MGFFEIPPRPDDELAPPEEEELPEPRWLGGALPLEDLIAVSEQAAVGVRGIVAYRDGFRLELLAWLRQPPPRRRRRWMPGSHIVVDSHHHAGLWQEDGTVSPSFVRFGIQFADGGRVTNVDDALGWPDATEPMHGLESRGGSSSDDQADQEYWVWPVPETGDLDLVCEWPAYGIPESRLTVNGDDLRAAAARARLIWPDDAAAEDDDGEARPRRHGSRGRTRMAGLRTGRVFRSTAAGPAPAGAAGSSPGSAAGTGRDGAAGSAPGGGAGSAPGGQTTAAQPDPGPEPDSGPEQDPGPDLDAGPEQDPGPDQDAGPEQQ